MGHFNIGKIITRTLAVLVLGLLFGPMPPHKVGLAGGTGWCSDYEGNNFPCSDGGGGGDDSGYSDYGGGGCANLYANSEAGIAESNSNSFNADGNYAWDQGNYASAAAMYSNALISNPDNVTARSNLGAAVNELGVKAYEVGNYESAWIYFIRAVENGRQDSLPTYEGNLASARERTSGTLDCSVCGKAIISDIGYGLDNSASFLNYSNQASANFDNCTRRIADSCDGTNGRQLYTQIRYCWGNPGLSDDSVRACVNQAWRDVNY